jgi:hypothetical protein
LGGEALVSVLTGATNPSGRLPYTYPESDATLGVTHLQTAEIGGKRSWPAFKFMSGLSYSNFYYSQLSVDPVTAEPDRTGVGVQMVVRNDGPYAGRHVVPLFIVTPYSGDSAMSRPSLYRLGAYKEVFLNAGESTLIYVTIPYERFSWIEAGFGDQGNCRYCSGKPCRLVPPSSYFITTEHNFDFGAFMNGDSFAALAVRFTSASDSCEAKAANAQVAEAMAQLDADRQLIQTSLLSDQDNSDLVQQKSSLDYQFETLAVVCGAFFGAPVTFAEPILLPLHAQ